MKKSKKFKLIESLLCYQEVRKRIVSGKTLKSIAKYIQCDQYEMLDRTRQTVVVRLKTYRSELAVSELIAPTQPTVIQEAEDKLNDGINEIEELEELYLVEKDRVVRLAAKEKDLGVQNRLLTQTINSAASLLMKRHSIKMDLGLGNGRDLATITVSPDALSDVQSKYGSRVNDAINNPIARGKVLSIMQRLTTTAFCEIDEFDEMMMKQSNAIDCEEDSSD